MEMGCTANRVYSKTTFLFTRIFCVGFEHPPVSDIGQQIAAIQDLLISASAGVFPKYRRRR